MSKTQKQPKGWLVGKKQIDDWLAKATDQLSDGEYEGAVQGEISLP